MRLRLVVIADDFTGAADSAIAFHGEGMTTVVTTSTLTLRELSDRADAVGVDLGTRGLPAAVAYLSCYSAAEAVDRAGAVLFKKVDSQLRGNLAAELAGAMDACPRAVAVVAPALPALGRTVRHGRAEGLPRPTPPLRRLFVPRADRPVSVLTEPSRPEAAAEFQSCLAPRSVVIADAASPEDLAAVARLAVRAPCPVVWVGSAGLARAVARELAVPGRTEPHHAEAQHTEAQHTEAQHTEAQHTEAQHTEAQHTEAQHTEAQHTEAQHTEAQHTEAQHTEAQHTEAQHTEAQHTEAQHTEAQRTAPGRLEGTGGGDGPRPSSPALALSGNDWAGKRRGLIVAAATREPVLGPQVAMLEAAGASVGEVRLEQAPLRSWLTGELAGLTAQLCQGGVVVLCPPRGPSAGPGTSAYAGLVVRAAEALMANCPDVDLVATGGETARCLLDALGERSCRLLAEVEPGVPLMQTSGRGLGLVTKAGSFGSPHTLVRAVQALRDWRTGPGGG